MTRNEVDTTFESLYSIADLAMQWKLSRETVRRLIKNPPGVVTVRNGRRSKRPGGTGGPRSEGC
jgi:hypothetical protein